MLSDGSGNPPLDWTSLASLTHEFWTYMQRDSNICSVRCNCSSTDTYQSIWQEIAQLVSDQYEKRGEELPKIVTASWS